MKSDARFELYRLQTDCIRAGLSYADVIWGMRYPDHALPALDGWPFKRIAAKTNVTVLKGRKKP